MLIVNADDWGRSVDDTNRILTCYHAGRITSTTAMVFMADSFRAADFANVEGIGVGIHLNFSQRFTGEVQDQLLKEYHNRIVNYITSNKYALLFYNPTLRKQFRYVFNAQLEEFQRLYGKHPTHFDGHHHMHLCTNMLIGKLIPKHQKVRRSFSFRPGGKSLLNRVYRSFVDRWLSSRYIITDYFFPLEPNIQPECLMEILELSKISTVEIMTHPTNEKEYNCLMSGDYFSKLSKFKTGSFSSL